MKAKRKAQAPKIDLAERLAALEARTDYDRRFTREELERYASVSLGQIVLMRDGMTMIAGLACTKDGEQWLRLFRELVPGDYGICMNVKPDDIREAIRVWRSVMDAQTRARRQTMAGTDQCAEAKAPSRHA